MGSRSTYDNGISHSYLDYSSASIECDIEKFIRFDERHSLVSLIFSIFKYAKQERGSVESALVLIPLLALFLISLQIGIAINYRNMDQMYAQSDSSSRAISGEVRAGDEVIAIHSPDSFQHLQLLVSKKRRTIPLLIPGLSGILNRLHNTEVIGISVIEGAS